MPDREQLLTLVSEIVTAHLSHNAVAPDQLPALIQQVFNTLATVDQRTMARPEPAVPIRQSVRSSHIVRLECGEQFSMIKRHLMHEHKLTPELYRQRWELPFSYPIVAPNYAKVRSALAKKIGLGRSGGTARKATGRMRGRG